MMSTLRSSAAASPASEYWPRLIERIATRDVLGATSSKTSCAAETATALKLAEKIDMPWHHP
jgi:hypothetical protein